MWWYGYKLPDTRARAVVYAHNAVFLSVRTISAAGRMLATGVSRHVLRVYCCSCNSRLHWQLLSQALLWECGAGALRYTWLGGWAS